MIIEKSIGDLENGNLQLHLIMNYVYNFCQIFSSYYRRFKILTVKSVHFSFFCYSSIIFFLLFQENRPQLLPTIYARIYLLKYLRIIFNETLKLFDIEPVVYM